MWYKNGGQPRNEKFIKWSWLSWQGTVIFGRDSVSPTYPFDITMWKQSLSGLEIVFHEVYEDMETQHRNLFPGNPFLEAYHLEDSRCLERMTSTSYDLADRLLLCVKSFTLRFSIEHLSSERIETEDSNLANVYIEVDSTSLILQFSTFDPVLQGLRTEGEQLFSLLTRELRNNNEESVFYHLLLLKPVHDFFERVAAMMSTVPRQK